MAALTIVAEALESTTIEGLLAKNSFNSIRWLMLDYGTNLKSIEQDIRARYTVMNVAALASKR